MRGQVPHRSRGTRSWRQGQTRQPGIHPRLLQPASGLAKAIGPVDAALGEVGYRANSPSPAPRSSTEALSPGPLGSRRDQSGQQPGASPGPAGGRCALSCSRSAFNVANADIARARRMIRRVAQGTRQESRPSSTLSTTHSRCGTGTPSENPDSRLEEPFARRAMKRTCDGYFAPSSARLQHSCARGFSHRSRRRAGAGLGCSSRASGRSVSSTRPSPTPAIA